MEVIGEDRAADHYEALCAVPGVGGVLLRLRESGVPFPERQVDHVAYFKYGYLIFITFEPAPDAHDVIPDTVGRGPRKDARGPGA